MVSFLCDRLAVMREGKIVETNTVDALKRGRMTNDYSRELIEKSALTTSA